MPGAGDALAWDRYAYVNYNPISNRDPTGHSILVFLLSLYIASETIDTVIDILSTPAITIDRAPEPTSSDMTGWLVDRMNESSTSPEAQELSESFDNFTEVEQVANGLAQWVSLVRGGAVWDYKEDILNTPILRNQQSANVTLGDQEVNYQAVANINYGYMAGEVGLPQWVAEAGAGAFQVWDHRGSWNDNVGGSSTWFDDPADNYWIGFGYSLSTRPSITRSSFTYYLKKYTRVKGVAPEPIAPGVYFE